MRKTTLLSLCVLGALVGGSALAEQRQAPQFGKVRLTDAFHSEGAHFADFNKDGRVDVTSGPYWWEGPEFTKRHELMPVKAWDPAKEYSNAFLAFAHDFNADSWPDILIVGFPTKDARWYENPRGKESHWAEHPVRNVGIDNESPVLADVFNDGRPVLVSNVQGKLGYLAPDADDPTKPWAFHPVSEKSDFPGCTHGLGVGDVNGDGRNDLLAHLGWWEQPAGGRDVSTPWAFHAADFGPGGAQMLVYDVDADGRNDVITALQAHGYGVAWFRQAPDGSFARHPITGSPQDPGPLNVVFSQPHALALADVDGDGLMDVVTGKRRFAHGDKGDPEPTAPAVTYWFQLRREPGKTPAFVPHLLDDYTGVGTQVVAADLNGDSKNDVLVGNKLGTTLFLQGAAGAAAAANPAADKASRKVLVVSMTKGFRHSSIPIGLETVKALGEQSKAFTAVLSDDLSHFDPEKIREFSAIVFLNTTGELPMTDAQKQAFADFVSSGKGFVGIHSATDTFYQWPTYGEMIGGYFNHHPWNANDTVTVRVEKRNALTASFPDEFQLTEEIYQIKEPYDRSKCDVCLSLETTRTDMTKKNVQRTDGDFPISWIKPFGSGRVFYTSLGHNEALYKREDYQKHVLEGIKWALGDTDLKPEPHPLPKAK